MKPLAVEIIAVIRVLPRVGEIVNKNAELYSKLETAHFRSLLNGKLDRDYAESCRRTAEQEAAIGLDARVRSTARQLRAQGGARCAGPQILVFGR